MPLKSDFEILVDLRNEVSRMQSFTVIMAFVGITLAVIVAEIGLHVTELESSLAAVAEPHKLNKERSDEKGQDDE